LLLSFSFSSLFFVFFFVFFFFKNIFFFPTKAWKPEKE